MSTFADAAWGSTTLKMKASEMIKVLRDAMAKHGDVEVILYGTCGAQARAFEPAGEEHRTEVMGRNRDYPEGKILIWTGIGTE